jgi:hypothetical protein
VPYCLEEDSYFIASRKGMLLVGKFQKHILVGESLWEEKLPSELWIFCIRSVVGKRT